MASEPVFFKLDEDAVIPFRATPGSAGHEMSALKACVLEARGKLLVSTGIRVMEFPEGCYGRLASRSGMAWESHVDVGAGVIDGDYAGEVKVMLFNLSDTDVNIQAKERVAQLIFEKYHESDKVYEAYYDSKNNLCKRVVQDTSKEHHNVVNVRGAGGFGSTGTTTLLAPSQAAPAIESVAPVPASTDADVEAVLNEEVLEINNVEKLDDDYASDYDYDDEDDGYVIDTGSDSGKEDNTNETNSSSNQQQLPRGGRTSPKRGGIAGGGGEMYEDETHNDGDTERRHRSLRKNMHISNTARFSRHMRASTPTATRFVNVNSRVNRYKWSNKYSPNK